MMRKSMRMYSSQAPRTLAVPGRSHPQIKDRKRVRDLAEVYTHEREVSAMLDLVPDMFPGDTLLGVEFKFLEPSCGSGNFLEEILRRKLRPIRLAAIGDLQHYEHWILRALASIYAVDVCAQNVDESRHRVLTVLEAHYRADADTIEPSVGFSSASSAITRANIVRADMLADASTLEVIDYRAVRGGCFERTWSVLDDSSSALQTDLFTPNSPAKRDELPVHYAELAESPNPTTVSFSALELLRNCG